MVNGVNARLSRKDKKIVDGKPIITPSKTKKSRKEKKKEPQ